MHAWSQSELLTVADCLLNRRQREYVYSVYEEYDRYMKKLGLWDEMDRVLRLIRVMMSDNCDEELANFGRLSVDECQDHLLIEVILILILI